jgi:hypothetical protein
MLASKAMSQRHNSIFYAKIDDHGVRWGDTGRILARWRRPVASRVALDLPYLAMHLASYCLTRMAFEMAREAGDCFSVVDFMSCMTVAKQPCCGPLKIKPSYIIVRQYELSWFVYYGGPPTLMNAILAIIANSGRVIIEIIREGVEIN